MDKEDTKIQHKSFRLKDLKYQINQDLVNDIEQLKRQYINKFTKDEREKLAFSQKVDYVYNTTALEGNTFTYAETETLLSGVTVGGHTVKEENEILNQKEAWDYVLRQAFTDKPRNVLEDLIKDIHYRVGKETVVRPGSYRDGLVRIGGTKYLPVERVEEIKNLMVNFVGDFKDLKQPDFVKAFILHFAIALVQPFFDGNKRTARLLMNYYLLVNDYPLLSVPVKQRKEYIDAMLKGYEELDINDLIQFLSKLLLQRLKDLI